MHKVLVFFIFLLCFSQLLLLESPQICVSTQELTKQYDCSYCKDTNKYRLLTCQHVERDESKGTYLCKVQETSHHYFANLDYICNIPERFMVCFVYHPNTNYQNNLKPVSCSHHNEIRLSCMIKKGLISGSYVECIPNQKLKEKSEFNVSSLSFDISKIGVNLIEEPRIDTKSCLGDLISNQKCEFYDNCIESYFQCGESSYPLNFGKRYCERSLQFLDEFPEAGKEFVKKNLVCLKENLRDVISNPSKYNCEKIREVGMARQADCFFESGYCQLMDPKNENLCGFVKGLWKIFQVKDIADFMALREITESLKLCREKGPEIKYIELASVLANCGYKTLVGDM